MGEPIRVNIEIATSRELDGMAFYKCFQIPEPGKELVRNLYWCSVLVLAGQLYLIPAFTF